MRIFNRASYLYMHSSRSATAGVHPLPLSTMHTCRAVTPLTTPGRAERSWLEWPPTRSLRSVLSVWPGSGVEAQPQCRQATGRPVWPRENQLLLRHAAGSLSALHFSLPITQHSPDSLRDCRLRGCKCTRAHPISVSWKWLGGLR